MLKSVALYSLLSVAAAVQVGYFESESCVDPKGMETCYENAQEVYTDCINNNCEGQGIDCQNVCACLHIADRLDCVGAHCWDRVYTCEYQVTANEIDTYCIEPDYDHIPFFPPPDDAPNSCSCNVAKINKSAYRVSQEMDTCGSNGEDILSTLTTNEDIQAFTLACACCGRSGILSSFYDICPTTDPSLLGYDGAYEILITDEEEWQECSIYMEQFPCGSDGMGFTPPGGSSAEFYEPDNFPASGTQTTSNIAGTVTAPISGETYTWTFNSAVHVVTVASADAKPTGSSGDSDKDGESDDESSDSNNDSNDSDGSNGPGSGDKDDDDSAASLIVPGRILIGLSMVLGMGRIVY